MQVIVAEPHRVLRQSQPRICGCRFLSDAKISPGDQRISTENVKLLIELNVRACRMSYPSASDWSINNRIEWRMEWQHTGAIKSILPKQVDREFKGVANFGHVALFAGRKRCLHVVTVQCVIQQWRIL